MRTDSVFIVLGLGNPGAYIFNKLKNCSETVYALGRRGESGFKTLKGNLLYWTPDFNISVWLKSIEEKHGVKPYIFLCSGFMLTFLLEKWPDIFSRYQHSGPALQLIRKLNDKESTYNLMKDIGVKHLPFFQSSELSHISENYFPLIAKWNLTETKKSDNLGKAFLIKYHEKEKYNLSANRILQPYIEQSNQYSFAGYFINGDPKFFTIVEQLRMYPRGASNYVKTLKKDNDHYQKVNSIGQKIVNELGYSGFGEFEFIYDNRKGQYYLLEVNPRTWGWISIFDLLYDNICDAIINPHTFQGNKVSEEQFMWINLPRLIGGNLILRFPKQFWGTLVLLFKGLSNLKRTKIEWWP